MRMKGTKVLCVPDTCVKALDQAEISIDGKEYLVAYGPPASGGYHYMYLLPLKSKRVEKKSEAKTAPIV